MSEKVSKPGDLDKFVPSKTSVLEAVVQATHSNIDTHIQAVKELTQSTEFNKFLDDNNKAVGEMPKWKQEAYRVALDNSHWDGKGPTNAAPDPVSTRIAGQDADVKHPRHYTSHPSGVECISIVQHHNFNTGNAIKYLWRAGLKVPTGQSERLAAIKDLSKAKEYIEFEIRRLTT